MRLLAVVLDYHERLLPLALVPLERPSDRLEPICALFVRADCRERILTGRDLDVVALWKLGQQMRISRKQGHSRRSSTRPRPSNEAQAVDREL